MTTARGVISSCSVRIRRSHFDPDRVLLAIYGDDGPNFIDYVPRSEFLAAVAAELDAVVIDHEEFPEVKLKNGWIVSNGAYHEELDSVNGPDEIRREAIEMLAIAEFLEANPPVDEAQVKAIADLLSAEVPVGNYQGLARRLYLAGVRVGGDDK